MWKETRTMPPTVESTQLWVPKWEKARSPTPRTKIIAGRVLKCFLYPVITAQMPKMAAESRNRFSTDFDAIKEAPREVSRLTATPESTQWIAHNERAIEPARSTSNASFISIIIPLWGTSEYFWRNFMARPRGLEPPTLNSAN